MGRLCAVVGDFKQARKWFGQEGDYLALGNKGYQYVKNLGNRATLEFDCGDYKKALQYCDEAISINEQLCRTEGVANQYYLKGQIYYRLNQKELALNSLFHARSMYMKMRSIRQAQLIDNLIDDIRSTS